MNKERYQFEFDVFDSINELSGEDAALLRQAQGAIQIAYAPYSGFRVGAAVRMSNGKIALGANQENASFPAGLCAEGVALAAAASLYPGMAITAIAISYQPSSGTSAKPISPCGICRQSLQEFSMRTGMAIRLISGGMEGKIYLLPDTSVLLPLAFTVQELRS